MAEPWYAFSRLLREEEAVTSVEYAMVAVLIAATCATILMGLSNNVLGLYDAICKAVSNAASGPVC